jgi:ApaG protein
MTNITIKHNKTLETQLAESLPNVNIKLSSNHYLAITENIEISVWPEFIDSHISAIGNLFVWAYHVRINNRSDEIVKLISRYWKIIDEEGLVQEVEGDGVIGEQPTILSNHSFQYSSGVHLRHPSGIMTGYYKMQKENGAILNVKIPVFSLDVPTIKYIIN